MTSLTIPLAPYPAPRPRFSKYGTYNPKKYTDHKKAISALAKGVFTPTEKPVKLIVFFYMPIPESWSKKKKLESVGKYHIFRPDADNLLKTIKDALNGIAYKDDSQVAITVTHKIYADVACSKIWVGEL